MKSFVYPVALFVSCALFAGCELLDSTTVGPTRTLPTNPANAKKLPQPAVPEPTVDAPVPVPPAVTDVPHGPGTTSATGLCQWPQQGVSCLVLFYQPFVGAMVKVTNASAVEHVVSMESYALGIPDEIGNQTVVDAKEASFPAGASGILEVQLPPCGYQVDVHLGLKVNHPPHALHTLLGFEKEGHACNVPPVDPPLDPPLPPDPPRDPPKPPVDPPLTDCNAGIVDRSFVQGPTTATATFRVLPGYAVRLWAAGYQRLTEGWDSQRFLGGVPPTTYTAGVHVLTVPAVSPKFQGDAFCGGEDLYGEDVTPANFGRFVALTHAFAYYVVED